jgi:hypothetical protein
MLQYRHVFYELVHMLQLNHEPLESLTHSTKLPLSTPSPLKPLPVIINIHFCLFVLAVLIIWYNLILACDCVISCKSI